MEQTRGLSPFLMMVVAVILSAVPVTATPMEELGLPSMTFESWSGYNPHQHATSETAQALADFLGGTVVETDPIAPPDSGMPSQRLIWLGGSRYLNAGLVAVTLMNNPYEIAITMLMSDGSSSESEDDSFGENFAGEGDEDLWTWDPFPPPDHSGKGSETINGGLNLQPPSGNEPDPVAEPASLVLLASGLMVVAAMRRRLAA